MVRLYLEKEEGQVTENFKDSVLNFLQARLGLYYNSEFNVAASAGIVVVPSESKQDYYKEIAVIASVHDVTYAPYFYYDQSGPKSTSVDTMPCITTVWEDPTTQEEKILNIPFEKLTHLSPAA